MKYQSLRITLTTEERNELEKIVCNGTAQAKAIRRANILLSVDESDGRTRLKDVVVARMLGTTPQTICQVKKDYLQKTQVADSIKRKKRVTPPVPAKIDGSVEAHIIAIACSNPPAGYGRWTLRLIADRMVELDYIDAISHTAVGKTIKNRFKPHLKRCWCIPPQQNSDFVAKMEDVLAVYARPYDEKRPQVCMDEKGKALPFSSMQTTGLLGLYGSSYTSRTSSIRATNSASSLLGMHQYALR